MDKDIVLLTTKQFDLYNRLRCCVSLISKEQCLKYFCGYCKEYYGILYHNYDDIIFFVKHFSKNVLKEIFLQDDLENFLRFYNND